MSQKYREKGGGSACQANPNGINLNVTEIDLSLFFEMFVIGDGVYCAHGLSSCNYTNLSAK